MKLLMSVFLLAVVLVARPGVQAVKCTSQVTSDGKYSTKYDKVDVEAILNSARLLKQYVDCVMDRGSCTQEGCFLREVIPDALGNSCSKCSDVQKKQAGKILAFLLQNHRKDYWLELIERYDPNGTFRKQYEFEDDDE